MRPDGLWHDIVYSPTKYRETEGIQEREQNGHVHGKHTKCLSGIRETKLHDKSFVRCISDYVVNAREPYQGCACKGANGGHLRAFAYDNPVPSPEMGRCNDYELVTQYSVY